ncbi:hypothetical protein M8998_01225 [Sphingobacterium sp. lm-10]|uniref:hypothetical protein n=1 Tax=Sphingobacterium sp. lm-10 TaxID=2944904 RepID=UPI0020225391|nr:hypothetical protein [Sphingobacterium sp. lm-10]MCL7986551.1 hypothetical protein [Sphingobacterium sp. lm-10]
MDKFSELLSKATRNNSLLRDFIKIEALKEFDNDYDIFYPFVKDKMVSPTETFRDVILKYAESEVELSNIEKALPLLNIYIPELPSGFNAESWNTSQELPLVAPNVIKNNKIRFFDDGKIVDSVDKNLIPAFPVLVVKNNERLRLKDKISLKSSTALENPQYEFIDDAYDRRLRTKSSNTSASSLIPEVLRARDIMGLDGFNWHRDYIYYGLTPESNSQGQLNRRIIERIVSMEFSKDAFYVMSDQPKDPKLHTTVVYPSNWPSTRIQNTFWTEGRFEIQVDVLIGNLQGLGTTLEKHFSAHPNDLYHVLFEKRTPPRSTNSYYHLLDIQPKEYRLSIDLATWDIQNNSFVWKFIISEKDEQETTTKTERSMSEFATNFGITTSGNQKFGLNFGGSTKRSVDNTFSISVTRNSDQLGTLETDFSRPVLIGNRSMSPFVISNPYVKLKMLPQYAY